jgi:hypothetical protein
MRHRIKDRIEVVRKILDRRRVKAALVVWGIIATYDTLLSQFVPEPVAKRFPKIYDLLEATSGWLPWWGWALILAAILTMASFEYAHRQTMPLEKTVQRAAALALPEIAEHIPDARVADYASIVQLFEGRERDKLLPLLAAGKLASWGRSMRDQHPQLVAIRPDEWRGHHLHFIPGQAGTTINQTFFKTRIRQETTYYDIHLNWAQLKRIWPDLDIEFVPLWEAATLAYEQTKNNDIGVTAYGSCDSSDDILIWYCDYMARHLGSGRPPLIKLYGNQPPSRKNEEIYIDPLDRYGFVVEDGQIILQEQNGRMRYENLTVTKSELDEAIQLMAAVKN